MKTTVGKVLSVVTATASVVFLGFVIVASMGGANWEGEARSIEGYSFAHTTGPNPQWTATRHVGEGSLPSSRTIEPVLVAVYEDKKRTADAELRALDSQIGPLETAISEANAAITTDLAALQQRVDELTALLDKTQAEAQATADQVEMKAEEVRKVETRIQSRREDVLRLTAQVDEIRTDRFRIRAIQQQLEDLIQQIDDSLARAERRRAQLSEEPYSPPAADAARTGTR